MSSIRSLSSGVLFLANETKSLTTIVLAALAATELVKLSGCVPKDHTEPDVSLRQGSTGTSPHDFKLHGTTIDIAPDSLGLLKASNVEPGVEATDEAQLSRFPSGSFVKRTMEMLSWSNTRPRSSREEHNTSGPRKIFSISRRSKDNRASDDKGGEFTCLSQVQRRMLVSTLCSPTYIGRFAIHTSYLHLLSKTVLHSPLDPMRAGTQTLIQALQAMSWTEEAENEDNSSEESRGDTDEEGNCTTAERSGCFPDDNTRTCTCLSIHALYKPVAHMAPSEEHPITLPEYFGDNELGGGIRSSDELVEDNFKASSPRMASEEELSERFGTSLPTAFRFASLRLFTAVQTAQRSEFSFPDSEPVVMTLSTSRTSSLYLLIRSQLGHILSLLPRQTQDLLPAEEKRLSLLVDHCLP
ncbi:hypothetical protein M422DRAFT_275288 [Sphaerobolus stellatus SS14]|uniref:Uncharacterized protein n=1 Tax=Sphaerobolus stellatus (strain SS14) TaxID=990650 RepID=A0A0C9TQ20_SPHS4|nr:hypothetical protein M422DRAFT_275288 [Sphaerobolus stellatus SS14]